MADKTQGPDLSTVRARLDEERATLLAESASHEADRKPVALDQQSVGRLARMDAMRAQAMAVECERRRTARLRQIDAALERIEEGEFGYCISCGKEIAPKRLAHDPAAATCVHCAGG